MIAITDRAQLLTMLSNAVNTATKAAMKGNRPMVISKRNTIVGPVSIDKIDTGTYTLRRATIIRPLYTNIVLYESAVLIAQAYNRGDRDMIKEILTLESQYVKYSTDMLHYLTCYRAVCARNEIDRMLVLEDKFNTADETVKSIKYKLGKLRNSKHLL